MATTAPLNHTFPFPRRLLHPKTSPSSSLFLISTSTSSSSSSSSLSEEYLPTLSPTLPTQASRRRVTTLSASAPDQPQHLSFSPPTTKDEAIAQARTCLANALARPLNNAALPLLAGKLKKQRQPRLRLEIPVFDDSADSLSRLALDLVSDLPAKRNPPPKLLLLWPTAQLTSLAGGDSSSVMNSKFESLDVLRPSLAAADVVVFFSPASSQLGSMREICEAFHPKPAVLFNPSWSYEEEGEMAGSFVRSFEVVYSFMGLEVRGVLSRKRGVVFRCVKDGGLGAGEGWEVMMEGEGGKMELLTKFKRRPAMGEVENVLYNVMAMNSPVTKTVKFLRSLASSSSSKYKDEKNKKN